MVLAIRFAGHRPFAAEMEVVVVRVAARPHAGRPGELEHIAPRRRLFCDDARRQPDAVHLADHRVLADPDAAADLGGGDPLLPQPRQLLDTLLCPGRLDLHHLHGRADLLARLQRPGPIHVIPPVYCGWRHTPHKISTSLVGRCQPLTTCCARSGGTVTTIRYHLREVSERSRLRGKARPNEPVEILDDVTRIVWLMEADREIVERSEERRVGK